MYHFYSATIQLNALGRSGLTPYSSLFSLGRMQARILQPEFSHPSRVGDWTHNSIMAGGRIFHQLSLRNFTRYTGELRLLFSRDVLGSLQCTRVWLSLHTPVPINVITVWTTSGPPVFTMHTLCRWWGSNMDETFFTQRRCTDALTTAPRRTTMKTINFITYSTQNLRIYMVWEMNCDINSFLL